MTNNPEISRQKTVALLDRLTREGGVDLHIHTTASDGTDSPEEIVRLAKERGLRAIAIADHFTIDALSKAQAEVRRLQLQSASKLILIPAVELSVMMEQMPIHLLAYFACSDIKGLEDFLAEQKKNRQLRNTQMLQKLVDHGIPITQTDLENYFEGEDGNTKGVQGRTHIALLLIKKGYAATIKDAFDKYLRYGRPAYVPQKRVLLTEACELIHHLGGAAVLAHPQDNGWCGRDSNNISSAYLLDKLQTAKDMGIDGIESFHGEASEAEKREMLQAAQILGLISTAGSDYHGLNKDNVDMYRADSRFYP